MSRERASAAVTGGLTLDDLEAIAKVIAKASADGASGARATVDVQNAAITTLKGALESRETKIKELEGTLKNLLDQYGEIVKANSELAVAQIRERVDKMRVQADMDWRKDIINTLGPGAKVAFPLLVKKFSGIDLSAAGDAKLLESDGTSRGDGRAALWAAVVFIMSRNDLLDEISKGIGPARWEQAIGYLQSEWAAAQTEEKPKTNGVTN